MLKRVRMAAVSLILGSGRRKPFLFFTFFQSCLIMMSYQKQVAYKAVKGSSGRLGRSTWRQYDDHHPPMHLNRQTFIMIELGIIIKVFFLAAQDAQSSRGRRPQPIWGRRGVRRYAALRRRIPFRPSGRTVVVLCAGRVGSPAGKCRRRAVAPAEKRRSG